MKTKYESELNNADANQKQTEEAARSEKITLLAVHTQAIDGKQLQHGT